MFGDMTDKKKYLSLIIIFCFALTAISIWYIKNKHEGFAGGAHQYGASQFEQEITNQGLLVRFIQSHSDQTDFRTARLPALYVESGESPTPFLEPGIFEAVFTGWIEITEEAEYRFHFEGTGQMELHLDESVILHSEERESEPVHLSEGSYLLRAAYASPEDGPARMRLLWSGSSFGPESIPPTALRYDESDEQLQKASLIRHGRYLMAEQYCISCHQPEDPAFFNGTEMPELKKDAQNLSDAGSRYQVGWMKNWLTNSDNDHPSSHLHNLNLNDQQAADIAVFLADTGDPVFSRADDTPSSIQKGGELFAKLGCVACHTLSEGTENEERLGLRNISNKWHPSSLADYLISPRSKNAWTKMPDFHLSDEEADAIVSFLFDLNGETVSEKQVDGDIDRGRVLVQQMGCASCHSAPVNNEFSASSLESLSGADWRSVFSGDDETGQSDLPHPELKPEEVEALLAFADEGFESLTTSGARLSLQAGRFNH
jgi:mono/diheme cytochrome c family protein